MLSRRPQGELAADPAPDQEKKRVLEYIRDRALEKVKATSDFLKREIQYQVVPICKLVTIQLASGLHFLQELLGRTAG